MQGTPIWARLQGFQIWPARFCSPYEEQLFRLKKAPSKVDMVAVTFLGNEECLFYSDVFMQISDDVVFFYWNFKDGGLE